MTAFSSFPLLQLVAHSNENGADHVTRHRATPECSTRMAYLSRSPHAGIFFGNRNGDGNGDAVEGER